MHQIVVILRGEVFVAPERHDHHWKYSSNVRPLAKVSDGHAICEVVLKNPDGEIENEPQPADLQFPRLIDLDSSTEEIELYDGADLAMIFRPYKFF